MHINDSKKEFDSRGDRHEGIGEGKIGIKAFELIMNDKRLLHIAKILETPKDKGLEKDIENMKILKARIKQGKSSPKKNL